MLDTMEIKFKYYNYPKRNQIVHKPHIISKTWYTTLYNILPTLVVVTVALKNRQRI